MGGLTSKPVQSSPLSLGLSHLYNGLDATVNVEFQSTSPSRSINTRRSHGRMNCSANDRIDLQQDSSHLDEKPLGDTVGPNGSSADADPLIPRGSSGNSKIQPDRQVRKSFSGQGATSTPLPKQTAERLQ